ncbi:hypothetical protein HDE_03963 [Halotydeus destructor]|nr:hypothetical protein HDE_03963 [Halotydeus destructor]
MWKYNPATFWTKYGKFRDNTVQTVGRLLRNEQLDGAVFDFDTRLTGPRADLGYRKAHIQHLLRDLKKLVGGEGKTIGLVAPVGGGPLQVESPAGWDSFEQVVGFSELSTHQLLSKGAGNPLGHRSAWG